jgi:hypothetical protein
MALLAIGVLFHFRNGSNVASARGVLFDKNFRKDGIKRHQSLQNATKGLVRAKLPRKGVENSCAPHMPFNQNLSKIFDKVSEIARYG